ncbi:MAG TPA: PAS domain S-box protein [Candidatus Limnocylindria bacterium]|nr:PAS domain S-box protein [Candidatus Limnocylindria bacterium]
MRPWLRRHLRPGEALSVALLAVVFTAPVIALALALESNAIALIVGTYIVGLVVLLIARYHFRAITATAERGRELEEILRILPVFVSRIDKRGVITSLRGSALETIGIRSSSRIGQSVLERPTLPGTADAARRALAGAVEHIALEFRGRALDMVIVPDPATGGAVAVGVDRTEQRAAERGAAEERRRTDRRTLYEELLDHVNDGFIALRSDGTCAFVNRRALEITGKSREDFVGRSLAGLPVVPVGLVRAAIQRGVATVREDADDMRSVEWRAYPSAEGVAIFVTDTTDRRRLEAERALAARAAVMSEVVASTSEGMILTSERVITGWNAAAERILGYTEGEIIGQHTDLLSVDPGDPRLKTVIARVMSGHSARDETHWRHKAGHTVAISVGYTPRVEPDGTIQVIAFFHDISEFERRRDALLQQERRLAERRDEALVLLAHEVRSPIAAMSMLADGLSRSPALGQRDRRAAIALRAQAEALATLAEDLLAIGQLEGGGRHTERRALDLRSIVTDAVGRSDVARIAIDAGPTPLVAHIDPRDMGRALDNLLSNALKYSAPTSSVMVTVRRGADVGVIEVADEGVGFTADDAGRLFRKYERTAPGRRAAAGIGLGLYLARLLVEAQAGAITGESPGPGRGATFRITVPLAA